MNESSADCVIVGGGIGGAVLALILGRQGKHVVLLEKETKPTNAGRPEILARSTVEIFLSLGAGERILREAAVPLRGLELYQAKEKRLVRFDARDFSSEGVQPYSTHPSRTREILLEAASLTHSVEVFRGIEVQDLLYESGRIEGVRCVKNQTSSVWKAPLIVGDDGGHSRIRQALQIPLRTQEFPLDFLGASCSEPPGTKEGIGQVWIEPKGLRGGIFGGVFMPQPESRTAFVFLLTPSSLAQFRERKPANFYDCAKRLCPRCEELEANYRFPEAFTVFKRPFGHAPRYVADGVALLGDAAHPVTPAGGQGANASVADAVALGDVALEAFRRNDFSTRVLTRYETERRPANHRSMQFSIWASRIFRIPKFIPGSEFLLPWFLTKVEQNPKMKLGFLRRVSSAFQSREVVCHEN